MKGIIITLLCMCVSVSSANAETLPSTINLERGWDSAEGDDYFVDVDINMTGPRLYLGYGESESKSGSIVLDTTTRVIGISTNPLNDISTELSYSEWGQSGEIEINTWRLDLIFNSDDWSLFIAPQTREIVLRTLLMARPIIYVDSDGVNLGATYYGLDPVYISGSYSVHDYSRNLSAISTDPRLALIFSAASLEHAYGFEKERLAGVIGLSLPWGSISVDGTRSVSEVDNSVSTSIAATLRYNLDVHWNFKLRGGRSDNSFSTETTDFASIGIGYQF